MLVTSKPTIDKYYHALVEKDPSFIGTFFAAVKTTGIFCIATCRARKPKRKNVDFYTDPKEPLLHGYRPCKICTPTERTFNPPDQVVQAIALVAEHPKEKITDYHLTERGIRPELVRRWFKKEYNMTFHAYQRMFRINTAFEELKKGKTTTSAAYQSGYESLSGFGYTFKKIMGKSPNNSTHQNIILIHRFNTPLGPMFACATDQGLCLLEFVDRRMLETEFKDLQRLLKATIIVGEHKYIKQVKKELSAYFEGTHSSFEVPLNLPGTPFQQSVWQALLEIPIGSTRSYQEQAIAINNPKAVRAVARANGANRVAIVIPCHRVIGKDGSLTGYAGGLERKQWLLDHEDKHKTP